MSRSAMVSFVYPLESLVYRNASLATPRAISTYIFAIEIYVETSGRSVRLLSTYAVCDFIYEGGCWKPFRKASIYIDMR